MLPLRDTVLTRTAPVVTIGLIVANALVWFWELSRPGVDVHVFRDGFYPPALNGCAVGVHALPWWDLLRDHPHPRDPGLLAPRHLDPCRR